MLYSGFLLKKLIIKKKGDIHMKKLVALILVLALSVPFFALADDAVDFDSMTFDELLAGAGGYMQTAGLPDYWTDWGHSFEVIKEKYGIEAEVIDTRTLVPFDYEKLLASVKKTGRLILVSDACARGSYLNDIARNVTEMAFDDLDAPPVVVGAKNWITPVHELEGYFFPQVDWIIDAIHEKILPLPGHETTTNQTLGDQKRASKMGV